MKAHSCNFNMVTILLLSLFFGLSCSNDADILSDAVLSDAVLSDGNANQSIVRDDHYVIQPNKSIILDILSNDGFTEDNRVQITEISSPIYGTVEINEDNLSITYTPQTAGEEPVTEEDTQTEGEEPETEEDTQTEGVSEIVEDNPNADNTPPTADTSPEDQTQNEEGLSTTDIFTYTTEVVNEDETTSTEVGTVEVVIESAAEDLTTTEEMDVNPSEDDPTVEEDTGNENTENQSAILLFSSGFEGVALSEQQNDYRYIQGNDSNTGFSWPPKILGTTGEDQEPSGIHTINDGGQSVITNRLETVVGHNGNQTTALYQGIEGAQGVTQTPYQINNIRENPNEMYITYWMKIDDTSLSGSHKWRALWEYKTDNYGSGGGFRMIAFIYTDNDGKAYWNFQGDRNPSNPVWEKPNFDIPVPRDEWFKVEYYFKWSEGSDGRAFMKVNGQLVGEHQGATTTNSKDLDFIILTQVYGDTSPMHQWVDDIEIWDGLPY